MYIYIYIYPLCLLDAWETRFVAPSGSQLEINIGNMSREYGDPKGSRWLPLNHWIALEILHLKRDPSVALQ